MDAPAAPASTVTMRDAGQEDVSSMRHQQLTHSTIGYDRCSAATSSHRIRACTREDDVRLRAVLMAVDAAGWPVRSRPNRRTRPRRTTRPGTMVVAMSISRCRRIKHREGRPHAHAMGQAASFAWSRRACRAWPAAGPASGPVSAKLFLDSRRDARDVRRGVQDHHRARLRPGGRWGINAMPRSRITAT
jgi:hypothetical protein